MEIYILEKFGEKLSYDHSAQLCLRLFCTLDFVPEQYHIHCTKEGLATLFSSLSKSGFVVYPQNGESEFYGAGKYEINDECHWLAVIKSIFTIGNVVKESSRAFLESKLAV